MSDSQAPAATDAPTESGQSPRSRLRRILDEQPEARSRLGKAVAALLGTGLVAMATLGASLIRHMAAPGPYDPRAFEPSPRHADAGTAFPRGRSVIMNPKATFRPHERLNDPKDFRRAFERRRSSADDVLVVYGVENGRDHARLGISVSRKKVARPTPATISNGSCARRSARASPICRPVST